MSSRHRSDTRRNASIRCAVPQSLGHYITVGGKDRGFICAVQARLNQVGCGLIDESGLFNKQTKAAAQLFQARSVDRQGWSLNPDEVVEPLTWAALFGSTSVAVTSDVSLLPLLQTTLAVAVSRIGIMREHSPGGNTGLEVDT